MQDAALPEPRLAAFAASTPTSSTSSSRKPAKSPIAFEPPPTHAIAASGRRPSSSRICSSLAADDGLELADELGIRVRPTQEPSR